MRTGQQSLITVYSKTVNAWIVDGSQFIPSVIGLLRLYILCDNNLSRTIRLEHRYDVSHGAGTNKGGWTPALISNI